MIQSFADSTTLSVWKRDRVRRLAPGLQRAAHRKLLLLNRSK
ncbi:hypothetical protein [Corynebacterium glyciniphilum]|nr:hypothetical protein [Corynebacterium glyciniphilum]